MKIVLPNTLVLLFSIMVLALLSTYVLRQGRYETRLNEEGVSVVIPGSYRPLEQKVWLKPWTLFTALPRAFESAQDVVFFIFIIGGCLAVVKSTGAFDAVLGRLMHRFGHRPQLFIAGGMLIFALGASALGMGEEYLPFVTIVMSVGMALGLDPVASVGIILTGYAIGYGTAAINPFTVVIAQEIAELKPTSGIMFRLIAFILFVVIGAHHLLRYARRIIRNPEKSLMHGFDKSEYHSKAEVPHLKRLHLWILLLTGGAIALIVFGISELSGWHWYLTELSATFFALTILIVAIARLNPSKAAVTFGAGASELAFTALLIVFARSIALILEEGQVLHTIVDALSAPLVYLGPAASAVGMYGLQCIIDFFMPSGSGQAYVSMPIMTPIADITGVQRQVAVLAYLFGDGFMNMFWPTNAVLMGMLGIARVPYDKWIRFVLPLMVKLWIGGSVLLVAAVLLNYR